MVSYQDLPTPAVFAHRGASAHAPENTLAAFELALEQGCDGIELDVMLTADRHIVVIHDSTLQRTTGIQGQVSALPLETIKRLDAGSFFDVQFKNERVPTLDETLEFLGHRTVINIELKNYESLRDDLPERVAETIRKHALHANILFSSFNPLALRKIKRQLPLAPLALLALPGRSGWWARSWPGRLVVPYDAIHPEYHDINASFVDRFHRVSKRVHAYTVNAENVMQRLFALQVDGIFTDDPLLARLVQQRTFPTTSTVE
jgi:glycerophosphoryl diester phosphodiesterase